MKKNDCLRITLKKSIQPDPEYPHTSWKTLEHAIYTKIRIFGDPEMLYRTVQNMVVIQQGEMMYTGLVNITTSHLKEISKSIEEAAQGDLFLEELNRKWIDYKEAIQKIISILLYMNGTYIRHTKKTTIRDIGLNLWRDNVVYSNQIHSRLLSTLPELVHREHRIGEVINSGLIKNILRMLMELGASVYEAMFESGFLQVSAEFYRGESQKLIECCDNGDYLTKAEKYRREEKNRVANYPKDSRTQMKIDKVITKEMIGNHMLTLIDKENFGLVAMILDVKSEDLRRMYDIFHCVPGGLLKLQEALISHVRNTCEEQLVKDPERSKDPLVFVQGLLDKKDKYESIINLAFNKDKKFLEALSSSLEYLINLNPHSPELFSLFLDVKLSKGFNSEEEDMEIIIDKVLMLMKLLHGKDMFPTYYKEHLAKRLLCGKSVSVDVERSLFDKLKRVNNQLGRPFFPIENQCRVLQTMIDDTKTSHDMLQGFDRTHPELNVKVLTTGCWSYRHSVVQCNLPVEVSALLEKYQSYYLGIHWDKRLLY